jgi:hypothetical protein
MKQGIPKVNYYDVPKVAQPKALTLPKPLKAAPHPHQDRLEQHREVPSLVTDRFKTPVKENEA